MGPAPTGVAGPKITENTEGSQEKIPGRYGGVGGCPEQTFWEIFQW